LYRRPMHKRGDYYYTTMRFSQVESDMIDGLMEKTGATSRATIFRVALREYASRQGIAVVTRTAEMKKHGTKAVRISASRRKQAGW